MTNRYTNKALLRELVKEIGLEQIAVRAECSASLLQKLVSDRYETLPSIRKIDGLCFATGKNIEELFPVFEDEKESA